MAIEIDFIGICDTPFWNESISWNTDNPYFSQCFKHLLLVIGSCGVLWLLAPFEFIKICSHHGSHFPWTKISIIKLVCKILLLIICVVELIKEICAYIAHVKHGLDGLIAAVAYFVTIVLTVVITMMCKRRGLRTSMALPSFWMISTITTLISIYDDIQIFSMNNWISLASLIDDSLVFAISLIQLILSSIADKPPASYGRQSMIYCPLEDASSPSLLTFSWLLRLLTKSIDNSLHQDHLIPLCFEHRSTTVADEFDELCKKAFKENQTLSLNNADMLENNEGDLYTRRKITASHYSLPKGTSLFKIIMKLSRKYLIIAFVLEVAITPLYFLPTYILSHLLRSPEEPEWHHFLFVSILFISLMIYIFADNQRKYYGLVAALRIKTALMDVIFEKALLVSQYFPNLRSLMFEDSQNVFQMFCLVTDVWGSSLRILIGLYFLWFLLGSASFVGIATAVLIIPLNILIENSANYFHNKVFEIKRERLNVLSEALHGMKSIKLYAWEQVFIKKLLSLRKSEISKSRKANFLMFTFKFLILSSNSLVTIIMFAIFVLMGNAIDEQIIFVSLSLIYLLKTPFANLLKHWAYFVQGFASLSSIQTFLEVKETKVLSEADTDIGVRILLQNASFRWPESDDPCLKNLCLNISDGDLIAIVGDFQSGKTSLLLALLGQMEKLKGTAHVKGEIAFVGKSPWIQNSALERNILFLRPKENSTYNRTLDACKLLLDIDALPDGDKTEIGDKGYQLTEDQKLKVDLARAVYQNAEIYLLDEPLRSTDAGDAEHLFQRVIGHSGILKGKIRIFTSRSDTFLPLVDTVLFLKDGQIVERGSYLELSRKNGYFSQYLKTFSSSNSSKKVKETCSLSGNLSLPETIKDLLDPWYSAAEGLPLKSQDENIMHTETASVTSGFRRKLLNFVKMNGYCITIAALFAAGIACFSEVAGWVWLSKWTENQSQEQKFGARFYVYLGCVLSQILFTILCGIIIFTGCTIATQKLFSWLMNRIFRASQICFETTFVQKISQSNDIDLSYVTEQIPMLFYIWLMTLLKTPAILVFVFIHSPVICVFSIPLILAFCIIMKLYMSAWEQLHRLTIDTQHPLSNLLKETLEGVPSIRAYKASNHFINRFRLKLDSHNNCYFLFLLVSRWLKSSTEIIGSVFLLVTLTIMVKRDTTDELISLAIIIFIHITESLIGLSYTSSLLDIDLSALERLQSFSSIKHEAEWENPSCHLPAMWPASGAISIHNLSTTYGEVCYPSLNNINLAVQPGEKIALVGKDESGAYVILDSLFRLREICEGQIIIDGIDIRHVGLHDLRSRLAVVPQDPISFDGTIKENLDPEEKYQEQELMSAIKKVGLNYSTSDLNKMIEKSMSSEEKCLFALARCILKKSGITILQEGGKLSSDSFKLFPHSTLLSFGNLQILDHYDRIIRVSCGEIADEELLS